jgi:hypothetical protein
MVAIVLAGCSGERRLISPEDVDRLAVNATLYVGKTFPPILLYRTRDPMSRFEIGAAVESGATVAIRGDDVTVFYSETQGLLYRPTRTEPPDQNAVRPRTTYRLEVTTASGEFLTATTTTPDALRIDEWVLLDDEGVTVQRRLGTFEEHGDLVYEQEENQLIYAEGLLEARINPTVNGGYAGYQVGIYSLNHKSDWVIDPPWLDEDDLAEIERDISSPLILPSEVVIRMPWFAIFFQERYKIKIFAVDRNWYDLVRSIPELAGGGFGFGGNAGDDFDRPIFHVEGGIGLFGSASIDSIGFFIHPRP